MKILIVLFFVLSICSVVSAKNKDIVYEKDTGNIIAVKISQQATNDANRINIICENGVVIGGANTDKVLLISVDEKIIPADITTAETAYKIDAVKKEIYQDVILEEKP